MTTVERPSAPDKPDKPARLATCCSHHADWPQLLGHLRRDFARHVDAVVVIRELQRAKAVVEFAGLDKSDQMFVAERITRQQLDMIMSGRPDEARLDPQPRGPRSSRP